MYKEITKSCLCKIKRHGHISSVVCHTLTPNSFGVNTTDRTSLITPAQTSLITARQMIQEIAREGIHNIPCSALLAYQTTMKGHEQDARTFKASLVYVFYGKGTYCYDIKERSWHRVGKSFKKLHNDRQRGFIYGSTATAIYEIDKEDRMTEIYNIKYDTKSSSTIKTFDFDSNDQEFFILKINFRVYKGIHEMNEVKINIGMGVLDLRVDGKERTLYLVVLYSKESRLCSLVYGSDKVKTHLQNIRRQAFCGHLDYLNNRVVVVYKREKKMRYFPLGENTPYLFDQAIDIDFEDEIIFVLSRAGNVMKMRRHGRWGLMAKPDKGFSGSVPKTMAVI